MMNLEGSENQARCLMVDVRNEQAESRQEASRGTDDTLYDGDGQGVDR